MSVNYAGLEIDSSAGKYIKIGLGEIINIRIMSIVPKKTLIHFVDKKKTNCLGKEKCELCLAGDKVKQRWACNVYDTKNKEVKIFEFGAAIARQIKEIAEMLRENDSTIHDVILRIKKSGEGLKTEYSVLQVPTTEELPEGLQEYPL